MNIQIFGTKKCNDTKKAQRFFKERRINFQLLKTPIVRNGKKATVGYEPNVWKEWD